jgi:hypothetical protein
MRYLALLALAGCSGNSTPTSPTTARSPVAVLAPAPNNKVDVLFMVDDSSGALDYQTDLKNAVPQFIDRLVTQPGGLASVHVGVVTSDLGTSAAGDALPAPGVGTCAATGKNGVLQGAAALADDRYIDDELNPDGVTRHTNYDGMLSDALGQLVSVGQAGCGFEQHLEAVRRALQNDTENHGFLRPDANLAVVLVGDEDDCSVADTALFGQDLSTMGPLQSFRCTRFGVTCDDGGATPDEMNEVGPKTGCHSNEQSPYLIGVADYAAFLTSLKPDPLMITVGAIVGDPSSVSIELRAAPGSSTPIPALVHSCSYQVSGNTLVADPGIRDVELANMFDRHVVGTICQNDLSKPLLEVARQINSMTGSSCLFRDIPEPHDCVASDDSGAVEACTSDSSTDCYVIAADAAACPDGQHLRLDYRGTPTSKLTLSCKLP